MSGVRKHRVTLIEGDGTGPEVIGAARMAVDAVGAKHGFEIEWREAYAGEAARREYGSVLPDETLDAIKETAVALKGPITTPIGEGFRSVNVEMRQRLDLYANVRPARLFEGVRSRYSDVDIVVIRENTEDVYAGIEFAKGSEGARRVIWLAEASAGKLVRIDSAIALKPISAFASRRISEFAFAYAERNGRRKVTAVHKANILKLTDGLFLKMAEAAARRHRRIGFESMIVDNMCMQLVVKPELYDVLLCPNLYGDMLSDLCSGLVGGLGVAPSANIGDRYAVFEPIHGSSPKHAGKNEVNPAATILSAALMLKHMGLAEAAKDLEAATLAVIREGKRVTYDLNARKPSGTKEMAEEIVRRISGGKHEHS